MRWGARYLEDELEIACSIQPAQRNVLAKLAMAWKRLGWKLADFHTLLETGGFQVSRRTIRRWAIEDRCSTSPTSQSVALGCPRLLDDERAEVVAGYFWTKMTEDNSPPSTMPSTLPASLLG